MNGSSARSEETRMDLGRCNDGDGFGCLVGSRGLDGIGSCSGDAALFIGVRVGIGGMDGSSEREGRQQCGLYQLLLLCIIPLLSLWRAEAAAAPVSKQERGRLPRFLPSFEARLLSLSSSRTGLHSSQRRSVGEERLYDTQESPAPPPRGRTDGRTRGEGERTGRLCNQANS